MKEEEKKRVEECFQITGRAFLKPYSGPDFLWSDKAEGVPDRCGR
jgi:hypothetical protein